MKIHVCDLCKQRGSDHRFKVKKAKRYWQQDVWTRYKRIEICEVCAEKLFGIPSNETKIKFMLGQNPVPDKKPVR